MNRTLVIGSRSAELAPGAAVVASRNPVAIYLASLAPGSRPTQKSALRTLARMSAGVGADPMALPWEQLRYQHTQALRTKLAGAYAPATAARHLAALAGVLRECRRLGIMSAEDFQGATDWKPIRGSREPAGRMLTRDEVARLFRGARDERDPIGARDAAMLALLYGGGMRRSEVAKIEIDGYSTSAQAVTFLGKGNKERTTYLPKSAAALVDRWVKIRGRKPGPLLCGFRRYGRTNGITPASVGECVEKIRVAMKVAGFTTHDLRRTYISDAIDASGDLVAIAKQVGHASVTTTQRYDRRGERAKQKVAQSIRIPD